MGRVKQSLSNSSQSYLRWLLDITGSEKDGRTYLLLLKDLYNINFIWSVPNDDNRAMDALDLRSEYTGRFEDGSTVSILEVLITIAQHMDDNLYDARDGECLEHWFWELIENIELDNYDDDNYNGGKVDNILTIWLNREYECDGYGGIFPSQNRNKKCNTDMRTVELWYQMSHYIQERYAL